MIDPAILVTQIIGFMIVLWVLRRTAWGPILEKIEERRAKIADDVASADRLRKESEALKQKYEEAHGVVVRDEVERLRIGQLGDCTVDLLGERNRVSSG